MPESGPILIEARSIGSIAFEVLSIDQAAWVLSNTSKGIFIESSSKWLIFLSFDHFSSPLTITLEEMIPATLPIQAGTRVYFDSEQLLIPAAEIIIAADERSVWKPSPRKNLTVFHTDRQKRLDHFAEAVLHRKGGVGFNSLLPGLLKLSVEMPPVAESLFAIDQNIVLLGKYIQDGKRLLAANALCTLLGWGEGLTPSGDDFVIGWLLSLNRWGDLLLPGADMSRLNHQLVTTAYRKTTTLSANLIECAALGQGDERLVEAVDFLICGGSGEDQIVTNLLNWGNKSGSDAFVGMAVALSGMDTDLDSAHFDLGSPRQPP